MKLPKIERYNQVVWAIVGTGFIFMLGSELYDKVISIVDMHSYEHGALPVAMVDETGTNSGNSVAAEYDFCPTITVDGTPYQLIRVASDKLVVRQANEVARMVKKPDIAYSSEYGSSDQQSCGVDGSGQPSSVVNVLIRNADTGAMHLALNQNAVIYSLYYPTKHTEGAYYSEMFPPAGTLYWEIIFDDSNGDGRLDEQDDVGAYLSDIDGRNLKRITPVSSRVLSKTYDKSRNMLQLRILRDTNGDMKLDDKDDVTLVESSLANRTIVREVLDKKMLSEFMHAAEPVKQIAPTKNDGK